MDSGIPERGLECALRVQNGKVIEADRKPGILARMLGSMLTTAREIAGLSYDEAAARLGCEADWLVRVETGFAAADPEQVARILLAYGVREARAADTIIDMARLIRMIEQKCRSGEMDVFWNDFFIFEAFLSISKGILKHHFNFPSFIDDGLSIKGFYHPLIRNPVVNSIVIRDKLALITGPNMSGKSTLLKAIGLCVTLAHLGLAVPAENCELAFFDVIAVAINLNDDILSGYSHFMTEIINLKNILQEARKSKRCFAIFDELFRGTNPEDALAISHKTIAGVTQIRHSCFFISTHLYQLRESTATNSFIQTHYLDCLMIKGKPVFTYTLREGWSDLRIGQILFEQEGLNELRK